MPADASRILEIEVEEGSREVKVSPVGPDFGPDKGKWVFCYTQTAKTTNWYAVPYNRGRVLQIDPVDLDFSEIGEEDLPEASAKYTGVVAARNFKNRLYAAPCKASKVLEIDHMKGTVQEVGPMLGNSEKAKWWAAESSPSTGKIYAVPYDARKVLEIDPSKGGEATLIGPDLGTTKGKYCCITLAPNGNMYAAPFNANRVLQIDPKGVVTLVGPDFGDEPRKYNCIVQAPNKLLYSPPLYCDRVLEINCAKGNTRQIGPSLGTGEAKWACAAVGSNGKVYCAPLEARRVLEIDCESHEVEEIGMDIGPGAEKYSAIVAAPVGHKLYAAPREAHNVLEIDPELGMVREVGPDLGSIERKFSCMMTGLDPKALAEARAAKTK